MLARFVIYAFSFGLIYRFIELKLIKLYFASFSAYSPVIYLFYGIGTAALFIIIFIFIRPFVRRKARSKRRELSLFYTIVVLVWLSLAVNLDLSSIHGQKIFQTSDWLYILLYDLGILFIPLLIVSLLISSIFIKIKKKAPAGKGAYRTIVIHLILSSFIILHSIVISNFIPYKFELIKSKFPNIILISVDTLRKDHISLYGYPRGTTPNLDEFFCGGIRFNRCISTLPETAPNYASIYTGVYPFVHGIFANGVQLDLQKNSLTTIATELKKAGYHTSSHLTAGLPGIFSGLDYDIDELYQHGLKVKTAGGYDLKNLFNNLYNCYQTFILDRWMNSQDFNPETKTAINWLDSRPVEPFYTHIYWHWPHAPYGDRLVELPTAFFNQHSYNEPFADTSPAIAKKITETRLSYDSDIYYTDIQLGAVVEALKRNEYWDDSIIIFTADHGEDLGERLDEDKPYFGHSKWLYESSACVPLIFILPGNADGDSNVVDIPVSSVDIAPTLLSLAGLACPKSMQGIPLFTYDSKIRKDLADVRPWVWSFNLALDWSPYHDDYSAVYTDEWTFIHTESTGEEELYHTAVDYHCTENYAETNPILTDSLKNLLFNWMETRGYSHESSRDMVPSEENLSKAALDNLRALGYVK